MSTTSQLQCTQLEINSEVLHIVQQATFCLECTTAVVFLLKGSEAWFVMLLCLDVVLQTKARKLHFNFNVILL